MKIKNWLKVTYVENQSNIRVDDDFLNSERDGDKNIKSVKVQSNGVVSFTTK